ncbi:leucine-rich repeat-containing protein 14-like [Rana temporaria]|uniref:leucine-rich repeat-containing protein 14-like n=1 Tax=Rana temporaria TaxID=8407 RepID=UPI001AAD9791|nr:leucine-rich repeat-containing protein 14-like [Rana temporaria]
MGEQGKAVPSLVCLCAQKLVNDQASLRMMLDSIPCDLYRPLFSAAFLGRKTLILQDLVQQWPFSNLSFQKLLPGNLGQFHHLSNSVCVKAVIRGVVAYLSDALSRESQERRQRLRILDITDDPCSFDLNEDHRSLRSHLMTLAKACIDLSKRCRDEAMQARKRSDFKLAPQSSLNTVYVDVWIDIFNYSTYYPILKEALQASVHGPLRLRCRNLHNCMMPLCKTGELLDLLNPAGVRRIELYNIITLDELNIILPNMVKFCSLRSVKLTFCINSIQRLKHDTMKKFATLIGQLSSLKELNLGYSFLSGCLQQLLGGIQEPLESLELGYCNLLPVDLYYLSESHHISSLKKLDLRRHNLSEHLLPAFLQLLAAISSSLRYLDISMCQLSDHNLSVLVPTLCYCSHLRCLVLAMNPLSTRALRSLSQNCAHLQELQLVVYSCPRDCYICGPFSVHYIDKEKLRGFVAELNEILVRAERTDIVWARNMSVLHNPVYLNLWR